MVHWLAISLLAAGGGSIDSDSSQLQLDPGTTDGWSFETALTTLEVDKTYSETRVITLPNGSTITVTTTVTKCKTGASGCFYNEKKGRYEPDRLQR